MDALGRIDLVVTSGGLGPTADDLTLEIVAGFQRRELALDQGLEDRIADILRPLLKRWPHLDEEAIRTSNRKQALVPEGGTVLDPIGDGARHDRAAARRGGGPDDRGAARTAPGAAADVGDGPPEARVPGGDRRRAGVRAADAARVRDPESEIALTLREAEEAGVALERLEITTCLRRGEVEIVTRYEAEDHGVYGAFEQVIRERHADTLFSDDGTTVDEQVFGLLDGSTIAVAESCTGGLLAARLTEPAGASAHLLGGIVAYSNQAKTDLAGVPEELIERHGAVSPEVARALADGAIERFGADVGAGVTGVAGPGGGTPEKRSGTCASAWRSAAARR